MEWIKVLQEMHLTWNWLCLSGCITRSVLSQISIHLGSVLLLSSPLKLPALLPETACQGLGGFTQGDVRYRSEAWSPVGCNLNVTRVNQHTSVGPDCPCSALWDQEVFFGKKDGHPCELLKWHCRWQAIVQWTAWNQQTLTPKKPHSDTSSSVICL